MGYSLENQDQLATAQGITEKLLAYCRANDWSGYDPYDALNSRFLTSMPFLDNRLCRLVLTQTLKRSPFDVRRLLRIPKTQNPKAIALFLSAMLKETTPGAGADHLADALTDKLVALRSPGTPYWCWGYSFPWQTRTIVVPRGAPSLVCTTFVADALLESYERRGDTRSLEMAASAAEYILKDLYWTEGNSVHSLSYPLPTSRAKIHNANFLGAALLARVYMHTGEKKFVEPALRVARYSRDKQQADGSWVYGEAPSQQWIDNFHTGYNLCALQALGRYLGTTEFEGSVKRGYEFYRNHFFCADGSVKYFHNKTYPIDIHCVAQSILTLLAFRKEDPDAVSMAHDVFRWATDHMWDARGFFYYRVLRSCTIRIPYMRWSQAWMLLATVTLLREMRTEATEVELTDAVRLSL